MDEIVPSAAAAGKGNMSKRLPVSLVRLALAVILSVSAVAQTPSAPAQLMIRSNAGGAPPNGGGSASCDDWINSSNELSELIDSAENCTGVPAGTSLDNVSGNVTLSTPGQTYENKDVSGCITVSANNVTIRKVRVTNCGGFGWVISNTGGNTGLVIEDSYLECPGSNGSTAITDGNFIARRVQVTNCENGIWAGNNATVEDSYVFEMIPYNESDPHVDGIQIAAFGGSNVTIQRNLVLPYNSTSMDFGNSALTAASGGVTNVLLDSNVVGAGGYTIDCQNGSNSNFRVTNNKFTTAYASTVGVFGPHNQCSSTTTEWSGNVYLETGEPVP